MPVIIDEVNAQVVEPPPTQPASPPPGRQPPDMRRIEGELKREAERLQRLWCD